MVVAGCARRAAAGKCATKRTSRIPGGARVPGATRRADSGNGRSAAVQLRDGANAGTPHPGRQNWRGDCGRKGSTRGSWLGAPVMRELRGQNLIEHFLHPGNVTVERE